MRWPTRRLAARWCRPWCSGTVLRGTKGRAALQCPRIALRAQPTLRHCRAGHSPPRCRSRARSSGTHAGEGRHPCTGTRHSTTAQVGERLFLKLLRQVQPGAERRSRDGAATCTTWAYEHCRTCWRAAWNWWPPMAAASTLALLARLGAQPGQRLDAGGAASGSRAGTCRYRSHGEPAARAAGQLPRGWQKACWPAARLLGPAHRRTACHASPAGRATRPLTPNLATLADLQPGIAQAPRWPPPPPGLCCREPIPPPAADDRSAWRLPAPPSIAWRSLLGCRAPCGAKTRIHGAYRLQEILLVNNDFVIVDFEGGANRPPSERRSKQSPLARRGLRCCIRLTWHGWPRCRPALPTAAPNRRAAKHGHRTGLEALRSAFLDSLRKQRAGRWPVARRGHPGGP
jgi:hypothetical protein